MLRSRSADVSIVDREADEPSGLVDSTSLFRLYRIDAGSAGVKHVRETTYVNHPRSCIMATALAARTLFNSRTNTGNERDSAGRVGEPAREWRSPDSREIGGSPTSRRVACQSERWGASGGWRQNDGKVGYMNQRDLSGTWTVFMPARAEEPTGHRSQSSHSSEEAG